VDSNSCHPDQENSALPKYKLFYKLQNKKFLIPFIFVIYYNNNRNSIDDTVKHIFHYSILNLLYSQAKLATTGNYSTYSTTTLSIDIVGNRLLVVGCHCRVCRIVDERNAITLSLSTCFNVVKNVREIVNN
jgi:hypothetical protein